MMRAREKLSGIFGARQRSALRNLPMSSRCNQGYPCNTERPDLARCDTMQAGFPPLAARVTRQSIFLRGPLRCDPLRQAIRYVDEHLDSKLKCDDLAAEVGLEPFAFARRFKLVTGITPHRYIIHCRLNRALQLLSLGELSLAEIALEVGCSSQSYLTALFRKHLDTTPGAYRLTCAGRPLPRVLRW